MGFNTGGLVSRRDLPGSYIKIWDLDLTRNQKAALALNIIALPLFVVFGWIFVKIGILLRPDIADKLLTLQMPSQPLGFFLVFLVVIIGTMLVHEIIHGLFFWKFTRSRPIFGMKLLFAYAGAPGWYIPRNQYAIIGVAPFIVISIAGFVAVALTPLPWSQLALFGIAMNAAGAGGDFYVSGKVMCQSRDVLIQDTGVGFTMFGSFDGNSDDETSGERKR